jgi:hypothetical protein
MLLRCSSPLLCLDTPGIGRRIYRLSVSSATNLGKMLLLSYTGLNIMGTAKKYQHKGAATLQVKKFTALADELNAIVRRLCPNSIDIHLRACPTDDDRVDHRGPVAVREEWVCVVEGAGSLDH